MYHVRACTHSLQVTNYLLPYSTVLLRNAKQYIYRNRFRRIYIDDVFAVSCSRYLAHTSIVRILFKRLNSVFFVQIYSRRIFLCSTAHRYTILAVAAWLPVFFDSCLSYSASHNQTIKFWGNISESATHCPCKLILVLTVSIDNRRPTNTTSLRNHFQPKQPHRWVVIA